jgi:hypothetical protein
MKTRPLLLAFAAAALVVGMVACALDFDRFEPGQGSPDARQTPRADAGNEPMDDASADVSTAAPEQDVALDDGGVDAGTVADGSPEGSPCTPSSACLTSAHNCGMGCAQTEQQCAGRCFGGGGSSCRNKCTMTEAMCITGCENTCSSCVQSAGCSATTRCADAAY